MPSKGIDIYSYISPHLEHLYQIEFTVPQQRERFQSSDNFSHRHVEVDSVNIEGRFNFVGKFEWTVYRDGQAVASAFNNISALTGNLEAGSMMLATKHFTPIGTEDALITYGFYDAGHGEAGLTSHDQCYVSISPRTNAAWMGSLAPPGSPEASKLFSRLCLVAPHDNGMNTMQACDAVLHSLDTSAIAELKEYLPHLQFFDHIPDSVLIHMLPNIVYGVSVTQKKPIATMLALGSRYFEFRPAYLLPLFQRVSQLPDKLYFQHACLPGISMEEFIHEMLTFLDTHPTEIAVLHIRHDNIPKQCRLPTQDEVLSLIDQACGEYANQSPKIIATDNSAFTRTVDDLRTTNNRLIVLFNADKYDSWTAQTYATLHPEPIIARFESMTQQDQSLPSSGDLTILQCQGTSQSIKEVLVYSVVASNAATSCLTSTKAAFDHVTLPWLRREVNQRFCAEGKLVVILNDFIDGATCETGIELSRERLTWDS